MSFSLTNEWYIQELLDIQNKLKDYMELMGQGKLTYYKDISLKLRLLFMYKSGTKSLIRTINELNDIEIKVYVSYSTKEQVEKGLLPASFLDGLAFEQVNSVIGWFESGNKLVDIFDAINRKEVLVDGQYLSYKEIIEYSADKLGGAHLDKKQDVTQLSLHSNSLLLGGLPPAQRAIYDTARASVHLIDLIFDSVNNGQYSKFVRKTI
ncbi:hypothetical protein L1076_26665 [Vibrio sp. MMG022]|uniref:hypothetical protein n=1 Tax=Vibrio sp. MMG023 TaxID=2909979 RepID=UPI001F2F3DA9|nr:hypothetical protein [Vibrio sp. MMG023]MCF6455166.1 hypothetical protein [Vibrio sp. MMG023]